MIQAAARTSIRPAAPITIRQVGLEGLPIIAEMNRHLFKEDRIINRFDRPDVIMLTAFVGEQPAGFKVGYGLQNGVYYSAKGGVVETFRREGIARSLLLDMMRLARGYGYDRFSFDTFPNVHIGMTLLALNQGFALTGIDYNNGLNGYRFRFAKILERD